MQTKEQVRQGFIPAIVNEYEADNVAHGRPYKDRILAAGAIALKGGVERIAPGEYKVQSSGTGTVRYHVNGTCSCPDGKPDAQGVTRAPHGWCKHRMSVRIDVRVEAKMKELTDLRVPHAHTWDCPAHRDLPIECWTRACGDPLKIPCPTCAPTTPHASESEPPFNNPNVPACVEQIIAFEGVPTQDYTINPETGEIDEEPTMMRTIGETIKSVVSSLNGHAGGVHPIDVPQDVPQDVPLTPEQYEPAPVLTPKTPALPEAGASLNIKLRMENAEIMYTMRGHQDGEVLERLPEVLATLERILKIEVDHEEPFMKRLLHAFFPKPSRYTGK